MNRSTILEFIKNFLITTVLFVLTVFLPAGTLNYWQAWLSLTVFLVATYWLGFWLMKHDSALLERRKTVGPGAEARLSQKIIIFLLFGAFAGLYIVSALDHRFGWSHVALPVVIAGDALIVVANWLFYLVMRENTFAAATIRVEQNQQVISTGLYGIIRHPMYAGALIEMIAIPLSLGSYVAIAVSLLGLPILHWRIVDEEKLLETDLPGYQEYRQKVKYRLIPNVY